jgi:hypothetical protein
MAEIALGVLVVVTVLIAYLVGRQDGAASARKMVLQEWLKDIRGAKEEV